MDALIALVLGLVLGLVARPAMNWIRVRSRAAPADLEASAPEISEQLSAAVSLASGAVLVAGPYDEVLVSNPMARTLSVVRGRRIYPQELLDMVREVRRTGQQMETTLKRRRELGVPLMELDVRIAALNDGIVLVFVEDRSAQTRTDEIKRDFVGNVSHELKTPVGAVRVLAEALQDGADDPEMVRKFAGRLIVESERLSELIHTIIGFSRLQAEDPLMHPDVVEVDQVIDDAISQCWGIADSRRVEIIRSATPGLTVLGNAGQLTSAVVNLIQNAIAYSDEEARVSVTIRETTDEQEEFVEMAVSDNGIGIAQDEFERIFERFYRVDYARNRSDGGTGLGLAIVKHAVTAHGGSVTVWSKPGQGSTFTLRLPAYRQPSELAGGPIPADKENQ